MELVALAKNPVPSGAVAGAFRSDKLRLRFARWEPTRGPSRGTVCLFQGRGEFIEKYFEVIADLRRRGFAVATMDWRGQGGSERLLSNPRKGHVRSFADYDRDLAAFMKEIVLPDCQPPYIAMAHSMGGHILLRNAILPSSWFSRMVLSAPMIEIAAGAAGQGGAFFARSTRRRSAPRGLARSMPRAEATSRSKWARSKAIPSRPIANAICATARCSRRLPGLGLGSPTIGWLRAAFRSIARLTAPDYPLKVQVPLLLFAAGMDTIVSTTAIEEFGLRLKVGTHVLLSQARHEILQETAEVRKDFWAAFDAYMGVDEPVG